MSQTTPGGLRSALVRAARAELDENGSAAVSLRAVARRAGLSHAAPAYAFGDRSGLLTAVAAQGFEELAAVMDEPAPPGRDGLAELGRRYVAFARANPALYEVMFRPGELRADDGDLQTARAASLQALNRTTRPRDPRTPADGQVPAEEVALVAWAFAHGVASLATQGALPHSAVPALVDRFATLALT